MNNNLISYLVETKAILSEKLKNENNRRYYERWIKPRKECDSAIQERIMRLGQEVKFLQIEFNDYQALSNLAKATFDRDFAEKCD